MRLRAGILVVALLVAVAAVSVVLQGRDTAVPPNAAEGAPPSVSPSAPSPSPSPTRTEDLEALLTDPAAAATADAEVLHLAAATMLGDVVTPAWRDRIEARLGDWPMLVGTAEVDRDGVVTYDLTWTGLTRTEGEQVVLRTVPAATALGDTAFRIRVTADGRTLDTEVDREGARAVVEVPGTSAAPPLRVTGSYVVPGLEQVQDDGGPAGFGLLARRDDVTTLAHWLPLPVLPSDAGPMEARGDVGAFPAAAWSLVVEHPLDLVTGGVEGPCPRTREGCTWVRGLGLRDVSAVVLDIASTATATGIRATVPAGGPSTDTQAVAEVTAELTAALALDLGELPWPEVDVVPVPFRGGAAGMEFPGMIWVDDDAWEPDGFGAYVLAHEVGHQWFHALVGNGSLSAPVVDESLAQYSAYLAIAGVFGNARATSLADNAFGGRHAAAVDDGVPDEAPAQPLGAFSSDRSYGAAVYGRAAQAWVDAEAAVGRDVVIDVLARLVEAFGFGAVDETGVLAVVDEVSAEASVIIREGWGLPAP